MKKPPPLPSVEEVAALPAKRVVVPKLLSAQEVKDLEGTLLKPEQISTVFTENVDVFCADTGDCILKFRKDVIPQSLIAPSYAGLVKAGESVSDNRGMAAGPLSDEEARRMVASEGGKGFIRLDEYRIRVINANGQISKTTRARRTNGGIAGYFGRTARQPYCRMTAFTQAHFPEFMAAHPLMLLVDRFYEALMPEAWAKQKAFVANAHDDFYIKDTVFSTLTVNKNFPTACHYDAGDFRDGFGNLVVLRKGVYEGGYTSFPQYKAGVDVCTRDILLMDVHRLHGNTPIKFVDRGAVRLAIVMYFREDVAACQSATEEIKFGRKRMESRA
jgi:hypothetical protein